MKDEAGEGEQGPNHEDFFCHAKEFQLNPNSNGEPLKSFKSILRAGCGGSCL